VDLDKLFGISLINDVIYDTDTKEFYFLCNKKDGKVGFYLIKFNEDDPSKYSYLTMWNHKLDIGDVNMQILREKDNPDGCKELLIGYKTIYINTYNLVVIDLAGDEDKRATLFRHESFQLWESAVFGMNLSVSKDFVSLSKAGMNILALGSTSKKELRGSDGSKKMIHSLDSLSYLKVDPLNFINFKCQDYGNRVISIEQEEEIFKGDIREHQYREIYKIKIHEITLRELMILQSFYICKTQSEIVDLVKLQPNPRFFYKTFLELDASNMASILAFDSRAMESLLRDENSQYFSEEYPIIYKNKIRKKTGKDFYYISALDAALKNNQVKAVNKMIEYVVKYQNNYVSSYLFLKILPALMQKDIKIQAILES